MKCEWKRAGFINGISPFISMEISQRIISVIIKHLRGYEGHANQYVREIQYTAMHLVNTEGHAHLHMQAGNWKAYQNFFQYKKLDPPVA